MTPSQQKLLDQLAALGEVRMVQSNAKRIVDAIAQKNIRALDSLLSDGQTYQDVSKAVFLTKMDAVFEDLKGEEPLLKFEGHCQSGACPNQGKCGVLFFDEETKSHFSLIIEEDQNGQVGDMYACHDFACSNENVIFREENCKNPFFYDDEKANFIPDKVYIDFNKRWKKALNELQKREPTTFSVSDIEQWLTTFKPLLDTPLKRYKFYKNHAAFQSSYYHLTALVGYFSNKDACQDALSVWDDLDATHEFSVIKWLIAYSDLNRCFALFEKQVLPFFNPETQQLQLKIPMRICLSSNDWSVLLQFFQTYQKQYNAYYALYQQKVRLVCPDFSAKTKPSLAELVAKLNINTAILVYRKRLKKNTFLYGNSNGFDPMEPGVSYDWNTHTKTIHPENGSGSFEIVELE